MNPLNIIFVNPLNLEEFFKSEMFDRLKAALQHFDKKNKVVLLTNSGKFPAEFFNFYTSLFSKLGFEIQSLPLGGLSDESIRNIWQDNCIFLLTEIEVADVIKKSIVEETKKTIQQELSDSKLLICFNDGCFFLCPHDLTVMQPSLGLLPFQLVPAPPNPMLVTDFFRMNPGILHLVFADRGSGFVLDEQKIKIVPAVNTGEQKYFAGISVYKKEMTYPLPLDSDELGFLL